METTKSIRICIPIDVMQNSVLNKIPFTGNSIYAFISIYKNEEFILSDDIITNDKEKIFTIGTVNIEKKNRFFVPKVARELNIINFLDKKFLFYIHTDKTIRIKSIN